ncbi:GHKL domain-containing protein [Erwinia sp. CPCC 100877]|nr:GHKL domain-containing protein [Erwinia sp. CPCC 100877]
MHIIFTIPSIISLNALLFLWIVDYKIFFPKKETMIQSIYLIIIFSLSLLFSSRILSFATIFYLVFHFILLLKHFGSWLISVISLLWKFTIFLLVSLITFDLPIFLFSVRFFSSSLLTALLIISQSLLLMICCYTTRHLIKKLDIINMMSSIKKKYRLLSILTVCLYSVIFYLYLLGIVLHSFSLFILSAALLSITGILFSCLFYFIARTYKQTNDYKFLAHSFSNITQKYEQLSDFKHDYNNILLSLNGYIETGDLDNAKQYMRSINDYSSEIFIPEYYLQLSKIAPMPIKSIIASFGERAIKQNIFFLLEVSTTINDVNMNLIDFVRCISILLNNSFEAVQSQDSPSVQVTFEKHEHYIMFTVKNPDNSSAPLDKLMKKGFSTKANHTGKGLFTVNKICNNYSGVYFNIERLSGFFIATITIDC